MTSNHVNVLIIGAGLSGIGAACHLKRNSPNKTFALLEARSRSGGTWDLFRYPGIRSDSDMYTLGYNFKPWTNPKAIADGPSILQYIRETASEFGIEEHIHYQHKVIKATWSTEQALWSLTVEDAETGENKIFTANFVMCCAGYYDYDTGHDPEFQGRDKFAGTIIHPQHWPDDFDYANKKVIVIGSGATAVTLVPALTDKAAHVTMLQRSPSYVLTVPEQDNLSNKLRQYLPDDIVYKMTRTRNISLSLTLYKLSRRYPKAVRKLLQNLVAKQIGEDFDMKHFTPRYQPWDERLCTVPDGDLFKAIRRRKVTMVTDQIDQFTKHGIKLQSGEELKADVIITATGLKIKLLGGMNINIDGAPYTLANKLNYKGLMLEDLPNFGMVFGYTNASWTLKADIVSEYMCRVLNHMDRTGQRQCTPRNRGAAVEHKPLLDMSSGYIQRALSMSPDQGTKKPWRLHQNYFLDLSNLRFSRVDDGVLEFTNPICGNEHSTAFTSAH